MMMEIRAPGPTASAEIVTDFEVGKGCGWDFALGRWGSTAACLRRLEENAGKVVDLDIG